MFASTAKFSTSSAAFRAVSLCVASERDHDERDTDERIASSLRDSENVGG